MFLPIAAVIVQVASPPSQVELNGFLLGQHRSVVEATFGEPAHVGESPDGWIDQVFFTDSTQRAYMVFGFTGERPDYVASIQLTGRPQASQIPFLGLTLGAAGEQVEAVLGTPTDRVAIPDWVADRWEYDGRNYTVEVDTAGQLFSIRLNGYTGLEDQRSVEGGPLEGLRRALSSADPRSLMMVLAPDVEIYRKDALFTYQGPALTELADSTGMLWKLLVTDSVGVRAALEAADTAEVEMNVRVMETGLTGLVYKFPASSPLNEILFIAYAGRWTAWEIAFR